jgi:hypothetical protein
MNLSQTQTTPRILASRNSRHKLERHSLETWNDRPFSRNCSHFFRHAQSPHDADVRSRHDVPPREKTRSV